MSLASIFNIISPKDEKSYLEFSFSNMDQHRIISSAVFKQHGVHVIQYELDPITLNENLSNWLYLHQSWHNQINDVLGVQGFDFTAVDFSDTGQAASFARLHGTEHLLWQQKLGTPS